jgi:biotin-dependent carboxylase-like uncharacterized protein
VDSFAFQAANLLVGNDREAAALEITLSGPHLEVIAEAEIALTGANMGLRINGRPFPMWQSVRVKPGDRIQVGMAQTGCRAYLSVTGGFDVPLVMGSRSTYPSGKIGGLGGRPLLKEDILPKGPGELPAKPRRLPWFPNYSSTVTLRAIPGPQEDYFSKNLDLFFSCSYTVTAQANRMGYRLQGPPVERDPDAPKSIISEPSMPGNIQVPADGQPIILLVEQTIGGYAKIATVITPDLHKVAQAKPGDVFRFAPVNLDAAHQILAEWTRFLNSLEEYIA